MLPRTLLALALVAVLLAGCGSQTLQQQSKSLKALAAEGGLARGERGARALDDRLHARAHRFPAEERALVRVGARTADLGQGTGSSRRSRRASGTTSSGCEQSGSDRAEQQRVQTDLERIARQL